ncbi:hypothetical protein EYZ11_010832 [Aspergillus tanneri]|uniref:Micro-fibrillar-associated protein 1 C-terminal domain-containing protein n=1 Tax=Aspergillus tanneri TaxID=1220188 RepID=A0A4S3J4C1_9EURO|nr:uncharacterized protein ATNIH1004_001520 [Aspergillus tanneri]KAA8652615.1 hypothetical protein ATNIH1004_001520 [Aspergillus tanneri]THC89716.1 hypothetical protein EYZ11_010832 [Aspergillus tanneri]
MPPPLPSSHRGMTANPIRPGRYRPGKPIAEEPSSEEEDEEEYDEEKIKEEERRRQEQQRQRERQRQLARSRAAPKASSFPAGAVTKWVKNVSLEEDEDDDEEGFVTEEEEDNEEDQQQVKVAPRVAGDSEGAAGKVRISEPTERIGKEEEDEEEEEEESSEEESSSEDEAPRRIMLRPTFIKKDERNNAKHVQDGQGTAPKVATASATETDSRRKEKADMLLRDQLEKDAIARNTANRAWDDDELEHGEEGSIDDKDGVDPEGEYAAWKLRELKRIKREREAIETAEKEREEIERRRNLTAEEREREDSEFIAKQKEEKEATRGQTGFMQRYFHKGAFFRDDMEREGLDQRNIMGARFADDVARETLPQYMQIRDMTKLGKKGRTRYRDLKTEDTGRFGDGFNNRFRRRDGVPEGITDERFIPDRRDDRPTGPTGANAGPVRERRRSSSRSYSPRRGRRDRYDRERLGDQHRPDDSSRRKRSPSPYEDRDKRRRVASDT